MPIKYPNHTFYIDAPHLFNPNNVCKELEKLNNGLILIVDFFGYKKGTVVDSLRPDVCVLNPIMTSVLCAIKVSHYIMMPSFINPLQSLNETPS